MKDLATLGSLVSLVMMLGACGEPAPKEPPPARVPASCEATPNGGMESRTRYQATSVAYDETCAAETQTRTCSDGTWSAWSGSYAADSCTVATARSCDGAAHGDMESRVRYQAPSAPYGSTCTLETQTRTCSDGTWSAWSGSFAADACTVDGPPGCDASPHGSMETRVRYQVATAAFGGACTPETQTRTCHEGTWSEWSGTFSFDACTVADARPCDGTPHGGQDSRIRYRSASVPFGGTCTAETQVRTCSDGIWSAWSGSFTADPCTVAAPASCDGAPHGQTVSQVRYEAASVPFEHTCRSETQTRTCNNGTWSVWTGSFTAEACEVTAPHSCDGTPHGQSVSQVRYEAASVAFGHTCRSEAQTRTCTNGTWSAWSGTFAAESCDVAAPRSCDGTAHGQSVTRVAYEAGSVPFGHTCRSENQHRACNDGSWSSWSGTFAADSCDVAPPRSCDGIPHGQSVTRVQYQAASVPFGSTCTSESQTRNCSNGTWSPWSGTFTAATCEVAGPSPCDGTPSGETVTRVQYQAASVPFGSTCTSETQSRSCANGTWSTWSGTFTSETCTVTPQEPGFSNPQDVALDGSGNLFVVDGWGSRIRKVVIATGKVSTLALPFANVRGLASDGAGHLFVSAATGIYEVTTASGAVTTLVDGPAGEAIAFDGAGTLFVAHDFTIRRVVIATGEVTTLAGAAGMAGFSDSTDGTGSTARFRSPTGLTLDHAGNLYVADTDNLRIRKVVVATGEVTTLAGGYHGTSWSGWEDSSDGTGRTAQFIEPQGILFDGTGSLFVADEFLIRKVSTTTGAVTSLPLERAENRDTADCPGKVGGLMDTYGIAYDGAGNLFVSEDWKLRLRKVVIATSEISTVAGLKGTAGCTDSTDGTGTTARFEEPRSVVADGAGNLFVTDFRNHAIRKVVIASGAVTTLAGDAANPGWRDSTDGTGHSAWISSPAGIVHAAGHLFFADSTSLRKVVIATGAVTTLAGAGGFGGSGTVDGIGSAARFQNANGVASDGAGNLFVVDHDSHTIRKVVIATGAVTTLAGRAGVRGSADSSDGTGRTARFNNPYGIAFDGAGHLFVTDEGNYTIRKVDIATGVVITVAGVAGERGSSDSTDGTGQTARFFVPSGIASDAAGNLYVADSVNSTIRMVSTATGAVTTLAGVAGERGSRDSTDGTGQTALFSFPTGIACDGAGNLFVADTFNNSIRKVVIATGAVTTLAGTVETILR